MRKFILLIFSSVILFSMIFIVFNAFFLNYTYPNLWPSYFTLKYWHTLLAATPIFWEGVRSSIVIGILNAILATFIGAMTARALTRYDNIGIRLVRKVYSIPLFIPSMALFIGVQLMTAKLGLSNSFIAVVIGHTLVTIPYTTTICISFFEGISRDMEEAALTLGSTSIQLYQQLLIPLLHPAFMLSGAVGFLISFSEYFSTFILGGGNIISFSMVMYPYMSNGDSINGAILGLGFIFINLLVFWGADWISKRKAKVVSYLFE